MGQHQTKFYRNKNSRYSSIFGGLLSLFVYLFIFLMMASSIIDLFNNKFYSMTETKTLMQNWELIDIKFEQLIDFGFTVPQYIYYET
jgi:hypothetical protein